jgi:hypothetical protein
MVRFGSATIWFHLSINEGIGRFTIGIHEVSAMYLLSFRPA